MSGAEDLENDNFSDAVSNMALLERAKKEFNRDRKLVIKNLPAEITEEEIRAFLEDYVLKDVDINKQQNQAIVAMEDGDKVIEAVTQLRDCTLLYKQVTLRVSNCDSMLCIAQLPLNFTEWMFREAMTIHGSINKCFLMRSESTGESKGYGFVEFSEPLEKIGLIKTNLDWSVIEGNIVHCDALIDRTSHGLMFEDLHSKCLLINNLPTDYKDPIELRELFSKFHKPVYCQIVLKEGESLGFGIIEFAEPEEAEMAFRSFSGQKINDTLINLSYCIPGMSAVHVFNRVMFKYGDRVKVNRASLHSDPVYPNPAFLKHNFFKLMVGKFPRLLVHFTENLLHLQQGYVHQLETHTNAKPGILGPAPNIPMSPLMDIHLQLGLLSLVVLDLKEKKELEGEIPEPLGKLTVPAKDEANKKTELPSLLGDPMTAQADIVLRNIVMPSNDVPDYPPTEKPEEPSLLGRPIRKLSLAFVQRLGSLMAMLNERIMAKGLLGSAPMGPPKPLMENLVSPAGVNNNAQAPKSLLGEIPGKNLSNPANFMGAVKALAFQKLMESPANNKNQILNALFGNQGNNQGGSGGGNGPQSLLGKPPSLMSLGPNSQMGQDRNQGDGLLPLPSQGQGYGMMGEGEDYGYDDNGGYDDSGYQGYGGSGYDRFGMNQGYGGPDSGYGDSGYYGNRSYGSASGMDFGSGGGGGGSLMGEYNGGTVGDRPYMGTPNRKNMAGMYGGMNSKGASSPRNTGGTMKDREYDSLAQQASAYAASTSAAYNQYENYKNYMAGYNSGYNNSGYSDYDSGYNGSGYGSGGWGAGGLYGTGAQGYNSSGSGYGRGGAGPGSGSFGASYGSGSGYAGGAGYGRDGTGGDYSGGGAGMSGQETQRGSSQGSYPGNTGIMKPPLPPGPVGTPQGQKRNSNHFIPSPEPSPEGDYIGQHSQGLGGHYADTYAKRQRLNNRFGVGAPY